MGSDPLGRPSKSYRMKTKITLFLAALIMATGFTSCEKAELLLQKIILNQLITSSTWVVDSYSEAGTELKTEFAAYTFQFNKNGTVNAASTTGTVTGNWKEDLVARTIYSSFATGTPALQKLNNTWHVTDAAQDYIVASATTASGTAYLKLVKQK